MEKRLRTTDLIDFWLVRGWVVSLRFYRFLDRKTRWSIVLF